MKLINPECCISTLYGADISPVLLFLQYGQQENTPGLVLARTQLLHMLIPGSWTCAKSPALWKGREKHWVT